MTYKFKCFFVAMVVAVSACATKSQPAADTIVYVNYGLKAQKVIDSLKLDKSKLFIEIHKTEYTLLIKIGETVVKSYPVVLGFDPVNDKKQEGDGCTPEGTFKVQSKYPHKSWSKFIWFDYPNAESRKKFAARKKSGEIPATARIGGEVGIHGVPTGSDNLIDKGVNWTLGCISLRTADINEIYDLVKVGTKVIIQH